ncbi:F-box protein [Phanerochaete sordida]|uniref:F-box protein n=1 Tax=Phanerochaete sordida TaxID=48140 RepID=A0A9P3G8J9_9APHY|nr:F-box protein [Phanerochaete sordida]
MDLTYEQSPNRAVHIPELLDHIFEHVRESGPYNYTGWPSKQDLFACSLTCRAWRESTFRHRFRKLTLYIPTDGETYHSANLPIQEFVHGELFSRAKDLVRTLVLHYGNPDGFTVSRYNFVDFVPLFPQLQILHLRAVLKLRLAPEASPFPSIAVPHLAIFDNFGDQSVGSSPRAICNVLQCFTTIGELRLHGLHGLHQDQTQIVNAQELQTLALPRVASVVVISAPNPLFAVIIQRLSDVSQLKTLNLLSLRRQSLHAGFHMARSLSVPPLHLQYSITIDKYNALMNGLYDLRGIPGIRRLTIAVELHSTYDPDDADAKDNAHYVCIDNCAALEYAMTLLSPACRLEHIEVIFTPSGHEPRVPTHADMLEAIAVADEALSICDSMMAGLVRGNRLRAVSVRMCLGRPWMRSLDYKPFMERDSVLRHHFPALDTLGVLDI